MKNIDQSILIIDDDNRNIFALKMVLKSKKYICYTATSYFEGLEILQKNEDIKLILMDMMMPDIDGYQAIAKLKESEKMKAIPVIAITAQAMSGDKEKCLEVGADGYVSKPVDIDHLMVYINKYL
ncbi:MAG: response regulator [Pelobium sp.]